MKLNNVHMTSTPLPTTECVQLTAYDTQGWESCLDSKANANTCGSNVSEGRQYDATNNKSESKQNVNARYGNSSDVQKMTSLITDRRGNTYESRDIQKEFTRHVALGTLTDTTLCVFTTIVNKYQSCINKQEIPLWYRKQHE